MENNVDYEGKEKAVTAFGVALADYPVFGKLTASAGFDYEKEAKDFDKVTTKVQLWFRLPAGRPRLEL